MNRTFVIPESNDPIMKATKIIRIVKVNSCQR